VDIAGKLAIVTGAASGIGRATAERLAAQGASQLLLVDVDMPGLEETARRVRLHGAGAAAHCLDLADIRASEAWFRRHGAVDILHNNAGVVSGASQFPEADVDRLRWIIDVNLTSLVVATQTVAQAMRDRFGGVIINTVSTVARGTGFHDAMYATTKAGVMMFTRCCASLHALWNVRVNGVLPGLTDTPILFKTGADGIADWMAPVLQNNERCDPLDIAQGVIDIIRDERRKGGDWLAIRRLDGQIERTWGDASTL
jgi:NAD(P)-dependent dehydrogenase (short-subunit alcohol dehydrogenase family)